MRPNSLFFDREQQRGFTRVMSVFITIAFLVSIGYILIRYKRFAYLLHGELLTTPMFGWLLLLYAALAFLFVFVIRWSNCRVKRLFALWVVAILLAAVLPRAFVLLALRAPAFGGAIFGETNLAAFLSKENIPAVIACLLSALCAVAARFTDTSVFPVPPFPLSTAIVRLLLFMPVKPGVKLLQQRQLVVQVRFNVLTRRSGNRVAYKHFRFG